jgi:gliding motility-associated-like protein
MNLRLFYIFIFQLLFSFAKIYAQCNATINTFPYIEDFETSQGYWVSGGSNSDWAYGTPVKNTINSAASGTKCWITGGLTSSSYNNAENSWLMSPCFNFSSLTNPQISFKVFWETERKYDGASFQYSIDGGNIWQTLGSVSSNSNCSGTNWFNYSPVSTLGTDGWCGTIFPNTGSCLGLGGSANWLTARHVLTSLAGQANVRFRFTFAAGTTCNNFDGFAVDDITISEAPPNTTNFIYSCSANRTVAFTNTSSICGANFNWNFGDVLSSTNTSNLENPTHIFSTSGSYIVSLTVTFPGNITVTKTNTITVLDVSIAITQPIKCWGNSNGIITATASGSSGYSYLWNTSPTQTNAIANNLIAGNYTVTVSASGACATTASINLVQPNTLGGSIETTNELCAQKNGTAQILVIGGVAPYNYLWSNTSTTPAINNLSAGNYTVTIKDANNCMYTTSGIVKDSFNVLQLFLGKDTSFCPGNQLVLKAGNFSAYQWQDFSNSSTYTVTTTGSYFVKVTDANGCTKSDTIKVTVDCTDIYFPTAFSPNKDPNKLNETFGPLGNLSSLTSFSMQVFGRWGQLIYSTNNPFAKWDGKQNGTDMDLGIYVWIAAYSINNQPTQNKKGTVMIIR